MPDPINAEFIRLLRKSGWTQTITAEKLGITQGAVSQIVNDQVTASPVTLRLLRILVEGFGKAEGIFDGASPLEGFEHLLIADLRELPFDRREAMAEALRGVIHTVTRPGIGTRGGRPTLRSLSSKRSSDAAKLLKKAAGESDRR